MSDVETTVCEQCGNQIAVDRRYVVWCDQCDWNLDASSQPDTDSRQARRAARAKEKGERLFLDLKQADQLRPGSSNARVASFVLALAVHLTTFAVFALGLYFVVTGFLSLPMLVFGIPLLVLGVVLRPRLGRLESDTLTLTPTDAPALYALLNRIGADLGAKPVDVIAIEPEFNAAHGQIGVRRRRVLWIGLSLWNILDDQQRVGLLGHELAHQVNGDLTHSLVVGTALRTLGSWMAILRARTRPSRKASNLFESVEMLGELLASLAMRGLGIAVGGVFRLERSLLFHSEQRAEYYADWLAAQIASTDAMMGCLDRLHLARPCIVAIRFAAQREQPDIWAAERQFIADLSAKEWERLRRLDARQGTSIDSTHPPTNLRVELLHQKPAQAARIAMSPAESAAISQELARSFSSLINRLMEMAA
jgi:Zn-dependent protease with chaperone function